MLKKILPIILFIVFLTLSGCKPKTRGNSDKTPEEALEKNSKAQQWQPLEVKAMVDNPEPDIGDIITYSLTVNSIPEIKPKIPEIGSQITSIRIVDIGEEGPKMIDGRKVWKKWYKLQADFTGSYIIPPVKVIYQDPDGKDIEAETSQIFIEVKSSMKEGEEQGDILDIKPLEEIKNNLIPIYILSGAGLLLLLLASAGIWLWLNRKKRLEIQIKQPPDEIAIGEMEKLKESEYLSKEDYRQFYFKLSEIFRAYIEARFCLPAQESTTEELIPRIEKLGITRAQKDTFRLLAKWEDLVKFARHIPTRERAEKDWDETLNLILKTRQQHLDEGGVAH